MTIIPKAILRMTSRLLLPPDEDLRGEIRTYRARVEWAPVPLRGRLVALLDFLEEAPLELQKETYEFSFGVLPGASLSLSRHEAVMTAPPQALRALKVLYTMSGYVCPPWESPDFLPVVLGYMASTRHGGARRLVDWADGPLNEVGRNLAEVNSPYLGAVEAAIWAMRSLGWTYPLDVMPTPLEERVPEEYAPSRGILDSTLMDVALAHVGVA